MSYQIVDSNFGALYVGFNKAYFSFKKEIKSKVLNVVFYLNSNGCLSLSNNPTNVYEEYILRSVDGRFLNLICNNTNELVFNLVDSFDTDNYTKFKFLNNVNDKYNYIIESSNCQLSFTLSMRTNPTFANYQNGVAVICDGNCGGDCFGICHENNSTCLSGPNGHYCSRVEQCLYCGPCYYPSDKRGYRCNFVGGSNPNRIFQEEPIEPTCPSEVDLTKNCNYLISEEPLLHCPGYCSEGDCLENSNGGGFECVKTGGLSTGAIIGIVVVILVILGLAIGVIYLLSTRNKKTETVTKTANKNIPEATTSAQLSTS